MEEIDRLDAITGSSLKQCRPAQFSMHFRAELPAFNVIGSGNGPNPVALKFKCKNVLSKKSVNGIGSSKTSFSSTWRIRHPEMCPGGMIAVPIVYNGDWSRAALISLVFVVHSKKAQRIAYSKGEILLVDDLCEERFSIVMQPRDERSTEDLKKPVMIHLLLDVWDADAKNVSIRSVTKQEMAPVSKTVAAHLQTGPIYQRIESTADSGECTWPENTDFLIERAIEDSEDDTRKEPCTCDNCDVHNQSKFDENANLVVPVETPRPTKRSVQYFCHQSVLAKESYVFDEMFQGDWTKDANVLQIRTFSPSAVEMFLNFVYFNHLRPIDSPEASDGDSRISFKQIIEIVSLAKRFEVERLRDYCDSLLTDRYLTLECAAEVIMLAEQYELPLLGQAAMSLLSWSMDEDHWEKLIADGAKHLLHEVISEARRKHMLCTVINSVAPY